MWVSSHIIINHHWTIGFEQCWIRYVINWYPQIIHCLLGIFPWNHHPCSRGTPYFRKPPNIVPRWGIDGIDYEMHESAADWSMTWNAEDARNAWHGYLVVWNMNFIVPYTGNNHPNWRTPWFFRGVGSTTNRLYFSTSATTSCETIIDIFPKGHAIWEVDKAEIKSPYIIYSMI